MTAPIIPIKGKKPRNGAAATAKKVKTDWQAVERDYRTGNFTLRELATKHGPSHQAIAKQAKTKGWSQDLSIAIKQATNAKLVQDIVDKEVAKGGQEVANTVLAAAEVNKDVILGHRQDIRKVRNLAMLMADELEQVSLNRDKLADFFDLVTEDMGEAALAAARRTFQDLVKLPSRIAGAKALSETLTKLQTLERTAFSLDDDAPKDSAQTVVARMTDAERAVRLMDMLSQEKGRKAA